MTFQMACRYTISILGSEIMVWNISIKRMGFLIFLTSVLGAVLCKVCRTLIAGGILFDSNCDYFGNALLVCTALVSILYCYYSQEELKNNTKQWFVDKGVYICSIVLIVGIFGFATRNDEGSFFAIPSALGVAAAGSLFVTFFFCLTRYFKDMRLILFILFSLWISLFTVIFFVPDTEMLKYYDIFHLFSGYNDMYAMNSFLWFIKIVLIEVLLCIFTFTGVKVVNEKNN